MTTPVPTPYPTDVPPSGSQWSAAATHCVSASPTPTATNPDGSILPAPFSDCAVSGYVVVPQPTTTVTATVQATETVNADSTTPYAGGYNTASTGYGSWSDFITPVCGGIFFVALLIYCVGLLVRWAKMALGGGDGALD